MSFNSITRYKHESVRIIVEGKLEQKTGDILFIFKTMIYKTAPNTRTSEQELRVAEGTRVGCVEHEEEAWSISYTNTLRAMQTQTHSEHCKIANARTYGR